MQNCGGPAAIASPSDTGARCFVAAPLVGIGLAPLTDSEVVAVAELAAASRVILLVEGFGAVVPPWRIILCCLARPNRTSVFNRARGNRSRRRQVGVDAYLEGPAGSDEIGNREPMNCIGIRLETVSSASNEIKAETDAM